MHIEYLKSLNNTPILLVLRSLNECLAVQWHRELGRRPLATHPLSSVLQEGARRSRVSQLLRFQVGSVLRVCDQMRIKPSVGRIRGILGGLIEHDVDLADLDLSFQTRRLFPSLFLLQGAATESGSRCKRRRTQSLGCWKCECRFLQQSTTSVCAAEGARQALRTPHTGVGSVSDPSRHAYRFLRPLRPKKCRLCVRFLCANLPSICRRQRRPTLRLATKDTAAVHRQHATCGSYILHTCHAD